MKKQQFEIGSWVVCLPGFNRDGNWCNEHSGGSGWEEDKIIKVGSFSDEDKGHNKTVVWPLGGGSGVFCQALRPATEWEIEHKQIEKETYYEIF